MNDKNIQKKKTVIKVVMEILSELGWESTYIIWT
jgi:hypothetical protein